MTRRLRTAAVSLALLGALAACGGSSKSSSSPNTTDGKGTTASNLGTNGSTDTSPAASVTVDTNFSGEGSKALCAYAKDLESSNAFGSATSGTDLKASLTKVDAVLNNLKDKAPAEIKADISKMFAGYQKIIELYKKYNYDTTKMVEAASKDPNLAAEFASISSPDLTAATQRVTAYFSQVCGLSSATT